MYEGVYSYIQAANNPLFGLSVVKLPNCHHGFTVDNKYAHKSTLSVLLWLAQSCGMLTQPAVRVKVVTGKGYSVSP